MIRKNESGRYVINYADPTQQRNVAELELNHKKVRLSLPEGKEKGKMCIRDSPGAVVVWGMKLIADKRNVC